MPEIPQSWLDSEPDDIVTEMRNFAIDHDPDGWPAVRMRQITALCDEIDQLRQRSQRLQDYLTIIAYTPLSASDASDHAIEALWPLREKSDD